MSSTAQVSTIRDALALFVTPNSVFEVRVLGTRQGTISGYFDDLDAAASAAASQSGQAEGVYFTINAVDPVLMARSENVLTSYAKHTTSDTDIVRRGWLPIDFDPKRPSGISSTDVEHEAAISRARDCRAWLVDRGFDEPILADSGNGAHLLVKIDEPTDAETTELVRRCLEALDLRFSDDQVCVDLTTFNPSRIWKTYGTLARKGSGTTERPHRLAQVLEVPADICAAPRERLEQLASMAPTAPPHGAGRANGQSMSDLDRWIAESGLSVVASGAWKDGRKWVLNPCPWDPGHTNRAAYIVELSNGAIAAGCHHNGCAGKDWRTLREMMAARGITPPTFASRSGASDEWREPTRVLGLPPAPRLNLALFPLEIASVAVDIAERVQCPPDYTAWGLLTAVAGLIGSQVSIRPRQHDDWTERACLWTILIGPPSSFKTPAVTASRRPLQRRGTLDRQQYERRYAAWEAECAGLRAAAKKGEKLQLPLAPVEMRRWTSDATIEKLAELMQNSPGLTVVRDEIAGLVGSFNRYANGEGDRQFWIESYSGGSYTVDRIGRGTVHVPDMYLGLLGGTQPDKAREIFGAGPDDGFAARVTRVYPDPPPPWEEHDRWPDEFARDALDKVCDRLVEAAVRPTRLETDPWKPQPAVRLSPEAGEFWSLWHTDLMNRIRGDEWEGRRAGRTGKYPGLAARLTLVFHLVDWAARRVMDEELMLVPLMTLARVLDLMDLYIKPMDDRVYRAFDRSAAANGGERIARWILEKHPSSFTLREVRQHDWSGLTEPEPVAAAVEWLAAKGWVREAANEQRTGRPAHRFDVNPRIWEIPHATTS